MRQPSRHEREALLELLLALGGPLVWTGPIPYDALRARLETERGDEPASGPVPLQRADDATVSAAPLPPVTGTYAA